MSSTQSRGRGRTDKPRGPLRKPGDFREPEIENVSQNDEKPPVQKLEQTVNEAGESGTIELAQGLLYLSLGKFDRCISIKIPKYSLLTTK